MRRSKNVQDVDRARSAPSGVLSRSVVPVPELPLTVPPLGDLPPEDLRRCARRAADWAADYLATLEDRPVLPAVEPGDVRALVAGSAPEVGEPLDRVLDDLDRVVTPALTHWQHPGFLAYFNASASAPGVVGELLTAALNVNAMLWKTSPAATELEQAVLGWLRQMIALPDPFWGVFYDGGSASTFHALAAAREAALGPAFRRCGLVDPGGNGPVRLRLYATAHTHSSVQKAAIALGLGLDAVREVATDGEHRMDPGALAERVARDRAAGDRPFCVVATIGTTSTTSVDPVDRIADVAEREGLWLHVDAAHGGPLAVLPEKRVLFEGWDRADSITTNPHKWLFVPLDCSALFTRHPGVLRRAFSHVADYLVTERTGLADEGAVEDYMDYGVPLGRRFRALKVWLVLRTFGRSGIEARLREHVRLAGAFASWVDADPRFERVAPVPMSTVCFRARPGAASGDGDDWDGDDWDEADRFNIGLMDAVNATGEVYLSHTRLDGRVVLRLSVSGLRTEERHVRRAWELLKAMASLQSGASPPP